MQELEFSKGSSYGLTLSLVAETVVELGMELRDAKSVLSRWQKSRRGKCATVQFQIVSPVKQHAEVERVLEALYRENLEPGPFLRGLRVEVALLNDKGKRVKSFVLGDAAEAITAATPGAGTVAAGKGPAKAATQDNGDEEEGGAYALADAPTLLPGLDEEAKPKEKPKAVQHTLKKRQIQFAVEWQKIRQPIVLFVAGLGIEGLVWALQLIVLIMALTANVFYSQAAEEVLLQNDKAPEEFKEGEFEPMYRVPFAISLVVGTGNRTFGQILYITVEALRIVEYALWLTAFFMCLKGPSVRGTHGQLFALIGLGALNLLVTIFLKLLPLTGLMTFAQLPLAVPELPLSSANIDRTLPLNAFWSWWPFAAYLFSILFTLSHHAVMILFAVYVWTAAEAIADEVLPGKFYALVRLGMGQAFGLLTFHLMSITGTTEVLRSVLWVFNLLWRAFYLWFIIWFALLLLQARERIENILTEEDFERTEREEDDEEDERDDRRDEEYVDDDQDD